MTEVAGPLVVDVSDAYISDVSIVGDSPSLHVQEPAIFENTTVRDSTGIGIFIEAVTELREVSVLNSNLGERAPEFVGVSPSGPASVVVAQNGRLDWSTGLVSGAAWTAVEVRGAATLADVTVENSGGVGLFALMGEVSLSQVHFERTTAVGVLVVNGDVSLDGVNISHAQATELVALRAGIAAYGGEVAAMNIGLDQLERGIRLARGAQAVLTEVRIGSMDVDGIALDDSTATMDTITVGSAGNTGISAVSESVIRGTDVVIGSTGRSGLLAQ